MKQVKASMLRADQAGARALLRTRQSAFAFPSQELKEADAQADAIPEECMSKEECNMKQVKASMLRADQAGARALLRTRQNAFAFPSQELKEAEAQADAIPEECMSKEECNMKQG